MKVIPTICPYCGAGCPVGLKVSNGKAVGIEYITDHPLTRGSLCPKGNAVLEILYHPDRLRTPLLRENGGWKEIGWDEALDMVARRILEIRERYGPDALGFLSSAKVTNEENYLFQKMARLLGTNNVDHCARLCHAPSVVGLRKALGSGTMTNPIPDLVNSRCVFISGSNFAENHPIVSRWVLEAKDRGAYIIVADPRYTPTAQLADLYLPIRPGTDIALLNGMMAVILREGLANHQFIAQRTKGFEALRAFLEGFSPEKAAQITGLNPSDIVSAARAYARSEASAIIYCMGVTQHATGTNNVFSYANLALMCGHVGRPGTGLFPLRGQNNVQGASDMGALAHSLPGYVQPGDEEARRRFAHLWGRDDLPSRPGLTLVEMMDAALEGRIRAMYIMGENPVVSDPKAGDTVKALEKLEFLVVQDLFMTETAQMAHLVLPVACWAEKVGSYTSTERRVQWSEKAVEPEGVLPDLEIIGLVGKKMGLWDKVPSFEEVLKEINAAIPAYRGITPERLKSSPEGLFWPCPDPSHPGTPILHQEKFLTPDGRATFYPVAYQPPREEPGPDFPLMMTTGRTVIHYNSGTMTRRVSSLSRYAPALWVELNPHDAEELGLAEGEIVRVSSPRGEIEARVKVSEKIIPGLVFLPFHFAGVNFLTLKELDPEARIPAYKVSACRIEKGGA
ncbi:MAG: formate dehydrogenase subunit alpha [Anaerolineae bacterium]|nr:formate dehydrogenase subunit alpha [Anaerolineae bacterium]MDW8102425.1 formate dehydrogenase subunit alpha [Anaerolineae bacterium]